MVERLSYIELTGFDVLKQAQAGTQRYYRHTILSDTLYIVVVDTLTTTYL